jgi:DNA-binding response OmpR family regulator
MATAPPLTAQIRERRKVLIVDSSPELNQLLMNLLDHREWEVQLVKDNQEALASARGSSFDLIITGSRTSGQEDIQLLRRLRTSRPHTRLIILTDEFLPGDVLNSIRERAFSYFTQPFSTEKLAEILRIAMEEPYWDDGIEILSATPNWVRLAVRCDLATADRLIQFYREASDLADAETEQVATAFREILLNAIEHGGHSYVRTNRMVMCKVKDPGSGFSLEELKHAALDNPAAEPLRHMLEREAKGMRPGGFGILMSQKMVDDLLYSEKGNEVLLIKYLDRGPNSDTETE